METLFRVYICAWECIICPCHVSMHVCLWRLPLAGLPSGNDMFPCGAAVRGFTRRGPPRSGGKGSPGGAYLSAGPGRNTSDRNTVGIDNYPVSLRRSGQSHTYYCLCLSVSCFCRCPSPMATCEMTGKRLRGYVLQHEPRKLFV